MRAATGIVLRSFDTLRQKYGNLTLVDHNKCEVEIGEGSKAEKKSVVLYEAGSPRPNGSFWYGLKENNLEFLGHNGLVGLIRTPLNSIDLFPMESLRILIGNDLLSRTKGSHYHLELYADSNRPYIKAKNLLALYGPTAYSLTIA